MGLRTGGRRAKSLKNRVKSSKIELRFREVRPEGCTSCTPVQQALILPVLRFYGSASAEPFLFVRCFSCWTGGTTAQVCRLPRRGETDARFKSLLKHRVGGGAAPAMHPSSASADFTGTAILRLCFGRAVFVCQVLFLLDWGARLRRPVKVNFFPDGLTFLLFGI